MPYIKHAELVQIDNRVEQVLTTLTDNEADVPNVVLMYVKAAVLGIRDLVAYIREEDEKRQ